MQHVKRVKCLTTEYTKKEVVSGESAPRLWGE